MFKRGDILRQKETERQVVVSYVIRKDDAPDIIKLYSPHYGLVLHGRYSEADLQKHGWESTGDTFVFQEDIE